MDYEIKPIPEKVWEKIKAGNYRLGDYVDMVESLFFDMGQPTALNHSDLGLMSEIGGLADVYKTAHIKQLPLDAENVIEQIGDVFFYYTAYQILSGNRAKMLHNIVGYNYSGSPIGMREELLDPFIINEIHGLTSYTVYGAKQYMSMLSSLSDSLGVSLDQALRYNMHKLLNKKEG